jgi:hypothetical protein
MNGPSSPLRWNHYVLEHGAGLRTFWQQHLAERERRVLFVIVKGFDLRMCGGLEMLLEQQKAGHCDVALIEYDEGSNSPSHEYRGMVDANLQKLENLIRGRGNLHRHAIAVRSGDGRRIASQSALNIFNAPEAFAGYDDIVLDISSAPRGIYLPLAAKILHLLDRQPKTELKQNFHLFVWEDSALDVRIQDEGVEEAAEYIANFRGTMDRESTAGQPNVWIPLLGENQTPQLERIHARVSPHEICPVLPSPSRNPRRGDNLVAEYHQLLFDRWQIDPRNFIYGSERNPFEVYRQITRTIDLYRESFRPLGEAKFVLSALSSKLLSVGALLVAYDFKVRGFEVGIAHVDCQGYRIAAPSDPPDGELFGLWLTGECSAP